MSSAILFPHSPRFSLFYHLPVTLIWSSSQTSMMVKNSFSFFFLYLQSLCLVHLSFFSLPFPPISVISAALSAVVSYVPSTSGMSLFHHVLPHLHAQRSILRAVERWASLKCCELDSHCRKIICSSISGLLLQRLPFWDKISPKNSVFVFDRQLKNIDITHCGAKS